ncbi:hypothetical protein [Kitasatospora phosalacinea]|uniref:hypothetical protein n=1 Tax=Kitasatospora phosalacinea TaxID=2065 RepID=UPI00255330F5|nr:hypothetical protein [Kitasatospora phosalacinea]
MEVPLPVPGDGPLQQFDVHQPPERGPVAVGQLLARAEPGEGVQDVAAQAAGTVGADRPQGGDGGGTDRVRHPAGRELLAPVAEERQHRGQDDGERGGAGAAQDGAHGLPRTALRPGRRGGRRGGPLGAEVVEQRGDFALGRRYVVPGLRAGGGRAAD